MTERPQKITFGELRQGRAGTNHILVYCPSCCHCLEMAADRWGDDVRLSDIEDQFVCRACGRHGAEVRPQFAPAGMGTKA